MKDDPLEVLVAERHSCRAFLPEPVPEPLIERMFALAQRTPSWCNSQAWQVILTSGDGTERFRDAIHAYAMSHELHSDFPPPEEYHGVYQQRRRESGFALYDSLGIAKGDMEGRIKQMLENFRFFGAPHVAVITSDRALGTYGAVDCGAYVAVLLLAAESMGIAAVPQAAIALHSDLVRSHFELPDDRVVVCAVSFGYSDDSHPANAYRTTRADLADVIEHVTT